MRYFKVPRLGSYLAVQLKFKSCLYEESLDAAFADHLDCMQKRTEQEKEKKEYEERILAEKEEKSNAGDEEKPEEKVWEDINEKIYETRDEKYVIGLDTLGQDREFSEEQRNFVL